MSHSGWDNNIDIPSGPQRQDVMLNRVSPAYFRTMGTPLLAGRDFTQTDAPDSPRVAVVNETFARKFMGGANPLGRQFNDAGKPDQTYQIVGLVKDTKYYEPREDYLPIAFVSFTQKNGPEEHSVLVIRSDEPLLALITSVKRAAKEMNPSLVLTFTALNGGQPVACTPRGDGTSDGCPAGGISLTLLQSFCNQMVRHANGIRNDGQLTGV